MIDVLSGNLISCSARFDALKLNLREVPPPGLIGEDGREEAVSGVVCKTHSQANQRAGVEGPVAEPHHPPHLLATF